MLLLKVLVLAAARYGRLRQGSRLVGRLTAVVLRTKCGCQHKAQVGRDHLTWPPMRWLPLL